MMSKRIKYSKRNVREAIQILSVIGSTHPDRLVSIPEVEEWTGLSEKSGNLAANAWWATWADHEWQVAHLEAAQRLSEGWLP